MVRTIEQIIANEDPKVVKRAKTVASDMLLNIHLAELREKMQLTQSAMADALGVKQPTISDMEKPGRDIKLSTLKRYVEASGGKVRLDVELPDGTHYEFTI